MSTPRDIRLAPEELALKLATADAVTAAGGQQLVGRETGRAQSVISDYCSPNTASFMPLDVARRVEALGAGSPGHPHITGAMARAAGVALAGQAGAHAAGLDDLGDWLALVARENADLTVALAGEDLSQCLARLAPAARERLLRETGHLLEAARQLVRALEGSGSVPLRSVDTS